MNYHSELAIIYQGLEKELMRYNPGCDRCGTCCNFNIYGHVLYASSMEVDFIKQYHDVPDFSVSDNICPFLSNNQCSIRSRRTLGCRIFYCDPNFGEISHSIYEKYLSMIKELSNKYNLPWNYTPFLQQLAGLQPEQKPVLSSFRQMG